MNRLSGASCLLGLICLGGVIAAESRIIQKPRYNADAPRIDLFDGVESGALAVRMMPRDENGGAIFIENRTAGPLTIELPDAFVGVQVLPQFSLQVPLNGGTTTGAQPQGQNQPVGGNANSTGNGIGSGNNGAPPGFFSVPAERTARIPYSSVCLRHGAVAPRLGNTYQLVRVEKFSSDPRLARLLARVGQGDESQEAHQAAAWHLANGLSWEDLRAKVFHHVNAPDAPWFSADDLKAAQALVSDLESPNEPGLPTETDAPTTSRVAKAAP